MAFKESLVKLRGHEGKYSNNPLDKGGETMWGITAAVARANGYKDEMSKMPYSVAQVIYKRQYWDINKLDDIDKLCPQLADQMFNAGVNIGTGVAAKFLQRLLNVYNRDQRDYRDIEVDGQVGSMTIATLAALVTKRGKGDTDEQLLKSFRSLQGAHYISIAEKSTPQEEFVWGWMKNRV